MGIRILSGGPLTTVQDGGRTGYQAFGVPVSGAVDRWSLAVANTLLDNDENEAGLEVTLLGLRAEFTAGNCICVTGGDLQPTLDGAPLPMYRAVEARAGQVLAFAGPKTGCRAYVAFAGGLDLEPVMGSRSTYLKARIGGLEGRRLDRGDELAFRAPRAALPRMYRRRTNPDRLGDRERVLRAVPGPQDDLFTRRGLETFFGGAYTVTPEFDRMGCRLEGPEVEHAGSADILSDGIALGAVQVPASGRPIVMLADRQTVGGYTKIAAVITADLPLIAQAKAGDVIRFRAVSIEEAQAAYLARRERLRALRGSLREDWAESAPPAKKGVLPGGTVHLARCWG